MKEVTEVETVKNAIEFWGFDDFIVRDCDSHVSVGSVPNGNFITYFDATGTSINILNKSTIQVIGNHVTSIKEKSSHSPLISIGLYGFNKNDFNNGYKKLEFNNKELYLSDVYSKIN